MSLRYELDAAMLKRRPSDVIVEAPGRPLLFVFSDVDNVDLKEARQQRGVSDWLAPSLIGGLGLNLERQRLRSLARLAHAAGEYERGWPALEVARRLARPFSEIEAMCERGELPATRLWFDLQGDTWRISNEALLDYLWTHPEREPTVQDLPALHTGSIDCNSIEAAYAVVNGFLPFGVLGGPGVLRWRFEASASGIRGEVGAGNARTPASTLAEAKALLEKTCCLARPN